jgi:hypothetical protein
MKATITQIANMVFLNYFNSKEIYTVQGFDTIRKAKNYCNKYGITIFGELPSGVAEFQKWD